MYITIIVVITFDYTEFVAWTCRELTNNNKEWVGGTSCWSPYFSFYTYTHTRYCNFELPLVPSNQMGILIFRAEHTQTRANSSHYIIVINNNINVYLCTSSPSREKYILVDFTGYDSCVYLDPSRLNTVRVLP